MKSAPVSMFVVGGLLLVAIGVLIGEHVAQNKNEPVEKPSPGMFQEELRKRLNEPRQTLPKTFETPDENLDLQKPQRLNDGEDAPEVIKRKVMRPVSPPPLKVAEALPLKPEELFVKASPSVVVVKLFDARGQGLKQGSGFFVRDDSTVVTNFHVIEWAHSAEIVLHDGTSRFVFGIEACDELADVAVLKVARGEMERKIRPLQLEPKKLPAIGSNIYVIGSPLGLDNTITIGIVSNNKREWRGSQCIQFDASISPGSSGSVLLNDKGIAIGIARGSTEGPGIQNVNFAAPAAEIASLLNENPKFQKLSDLVRETKRRVFDVARALFKNGTSDGRDAASKMLDQLPNAAQEFSEYWILRGEMLQKRGAFAAAIDAFKQAVKFDGNDSTFWYRIGLNYELLQLNELSLEAYRKGKDINPKDDDCWRGFGGRLRHASGKGTPRQRKALLLKAKAAFLEANRLNPNKATNLAGLGDVLLDLGENEGAVGAFRAATESEPNNWLLWFSYGDMLQQLGRHSEAVKAFEKALEFAKDPMDRELCGGELRKSRRLSR